MVSTAQQQLAVFDGYGYFEEGVNPQNIKQHFNPIPLYLLMTSRNIKSLFTLLKIQQ